MRFSDDETTIEDELYALYLWGEEWERCMVSDDADRAEWISEEMAELIEKFDHLFALDALAAEAHGATFTGVQERFPILGENNV